MKVKTIEDLWKEFKVRHYGKSIGDISRIQLHESEMIFHAACGVMLVNLRNDISQLPEDKAIIALDNYMKEIRIFLDKRVAEFER